MKRFMFAILAVTLLFTASPVQAQQWEETFQNAVARLPDMKILVMDPNATGQQRYVVISIEELLSGLVHFPDNVTRYVATKTEVDSSNRTQPVYTAADFTASTATSSSQSLIAIPYPVFPVGTTQVWTAFAAPAGTVVDYLIIDTSNVGLNQGSGGFSKQTGTTMIAGEAHDVWVSVWSWTASGMIGTYMFFSAYAVIPATP